MDKLIRYIEYRQRVYGHIERYIAPHSMYYGFGNVSVRVSDHMKYKESELDKNDYYFVIQPDGNYIFLASPKHIRNGNLYMKIVPYDTAKEFIKSLHGYSLMLGGLTDWYIPEGWNNLTGLPKTEASVMPMWDEFRKRYIDGKADNDGTVQSICNKIESLVYGKIGKGKLRKRMGQIKKAYCLMSVPQYEALMRKITEANS